MNDATPSKAPLMSCNWLARLAQLLPPDRTGLITKVPWSRRLERQQESHSGICTYVANEWGIIIVSALLWWCSARSSSSSPPLPCLPYTDIYSTKPDVRLIRCKLVLQIIIMVFNIVNRSPDFTLIIMCELNCHTLCENLQINKCVNSSK